MNFDFSGLQNTVVQAVASLIILILLVRLVMAYTRRAWGEMVTEVAFVLVIGWFVWFPDSAQEALRGITGAVTGSTT